ncbi:MAG TPA: acetyl-CoA C-acetyltransferase [Lacipirellulaceae bacterium]|nr:acetyl-CoA C-acetyltransferase [Lacipirellulaceae bacterium]
MNSDAFLMAGARTPIGSMGGVLSTVPATELGAICVKAALNRANLSPDDVDEVIMGNVVSAGLGQNPARQAAIKAGIPVSVGATTINKVCGSGLKSVILAAQSIRLGDSSVILAGGMENMSLAPYLLPQARQGYRMGNGVLVDSMIRDGLWDAYGDKHMGAYGDQCAAKYGFTRQAQDDFAVRSYARAQTAIAEGIFDDEIVPVEVTSKKVTTLVRQDEEPGRFNEEKLRALRPAFGGNGTVTAGNASSINDGAAAVVVVSEARCAGSRLKPLARIVGAATFSREPEWFTIAPIGAIQRLLNKINWSVNNVDLFEINEAFAAVTMAAEKDLGLPPEKVNIFGGAVALGHPIGASGARILVTLLNGLKRTGGKRGVACLCVGGGEAVALAVESAI